jgi:putative DNA primase/helicase
MGMKPDATLADIELVKLMEREGKKIVAEKPALPTVREFQRWVARNSAPESSFERIIKRLENHIDAETKIYPICEFAPTEIGQTNAAAIILDGFFRFSPGLGWLVFDQGEGRFRSDLGKPALNFALKKLAEQRWDLRLGQTKDALDFAKKAVTQPAICHVAALLENTPGIWTAADDFDKNPRWINCLGTTVDLATGRQFPSLPEFCHTKTTAFRPEPGEPKQFFTFLGEISCGDQELGAWLVRWFSYCLSGDMAAPFFCNFWGSGKNGKSTLINTMQKIFGDYAATLPASVVVASKLYSPKHDLATLPGVRLGIVPEVPPGRLATETVKTISGGDRISAEKKYHDPFSFQPAVKLTLVSNSRLTLPDTDAAIRRRVRLVPFKFSVPAEKVNPNLESELLTEAPQILSWLIQESQLYFKTPGPAGFPRCEIIDQATAEYLDSEDLLQLFIDEKTVSAGKVKASELYQAFVLWSETQGNKRSMSQKFFGEKMLSKGFERIRVTAGQFYQGISLCV